MILVVRITCNITVRTVWQIKNVNNTSTFTTLMTFESSFLLSTSLLSCGRVHLSHAVELGLSNFWELAWAQIVFEFYDRTSIGPEVQTCDRKNNTRKFQTCYFKANAYLRENGLKMSFHRPIIRKSLPSTFPSFDVNVSQMFTPRSVLPPSIWYEAVATPNSKFWGKVS